MWMLEKYLRCDHCGTRLEEWDPKQQGSRHAYIPQIFTCPGCAASGDALEAAQKQAKATGGGHGLRVRLLPKYVVDHQVRTRSPEQRRRLVEQEMMMLERERAGESDSSVIPRKATSLGAGRRPPPIDSGKDSGKQGLDSKPDHPEHPS